MKHFTLWVIGLCLLSVKAVSAAEIRYVTDELQLALYEQINSKGKLLLRLNSGAKVELLKKKGFFARIRTKDGIEGWTKSSFLIKNKPARRLLVELKLENQKLEKTLSVQNERYSDAEIELTRLKEQFNKLTMSRKFSLTTLSRTLKLSIKSRQNKKLEYCRGGCKTALYGRFRSIGA
jgi:SH3 domain protein